MKKLFLFIVTMVILSSFVYQDKGKKKSTYKPAYIFFKENSTDILSVGPDKTKSDSIIDATVKNLQNCNCRISLRGSTDLGEDKVKGYGYQSERTEKLMKIFIEKGVPKNHISFTLYPPDKINYLKSNKQINSEKDSIKKAFLRSFNRNVEIKVLVVQ